MLHFIAKEQKGQFKMAYNIDGNWKHIVKRISERAFLKELDAIHAALLFVSNLHKRRAMPNSQWFKTIKKNNQTIGHICGQGCFVSTVLSKDMTPRGVEI